ncbi:MAG: 50S ribosomal protein L11 methyltransferase [Acidithiobacillus sp.]|uniref:50S ribosomal protein L11 methyltransferase n=1 Tax=Acidithiobacillus sp. TaxID=1872118 RepID=UPI0025BBCEE0|nr:50S ribosomal protein L11 methyltransferase [Acidithiobacillus sp.]
MSAAWWQLTMDIPEPEVAEIEAELLEAGAVAVSFLEPEDATPIFAAGQYWPSTRCEALFDVAVHSRGQLEHWLRQRPWTDFHPQLEALADRDWVGLTQAGFPARRFGRLWIAPSWSELPDKDLVLRLDPGQAFGTGAHATTALCLHFLDAHIGGGETLMDYGCGSGILAIAALLLGARRAIAVDNDPLALEVARENARINGVADRLELYLPEQVPALRVPLLVANILANPLVDLAPTLIGYLTADASLALSGLLPEQEHFVRSAYAATIDFAEPIRADGWSLLSGRRKMPEHPSESRHGNHLSAL